MFKHGQKIRENSDFVVVELVAGSSVLYSPSFMLMYESIVKLVQVSNAKGGIEGSALRQRGTCERGSLKNDTDKFFREKHFPS